MSAAEWLETVRKIAPLGLLILVAGIAGGGWLAYKSQRVLTLYMGVGLAVSCIAFLVGITPGMMILYLS